MLAAQDERRFPQFAFRDTDESRPDYMIAPVAPCDNRLGENSEC
jgi:hypothetical protein